MNNLQIFENAEFGKIRTVQLNNETYFVCKDVADILGYQNGSRDINRHVERRIHMEYPKPVMRLTELQKMGFSKEYLMKAYRSKDQVFAWKIDMTKGNSPILFDTKQFEQYRIRLIGLEKKANQISRVV